MCLNYFPKYSDSVMGMSRHIWREKHTAFRKSDYSNRKAEAKFALDAKSAQRIVKTNYIDCVAAINDNHSRMSISLIIKTVKMVMR